jgi:carbamoyltransferase
MSCNILGINPFHNGSACVLSDGNITYFLEEDRLSRKKHDAHPFRVIGEIISQFEINEIVIAGINHYNNVLNYTYEDPFLCYIRKYFRSPEYDKIKNIEITNVSDSHHLMHALHAFYNSEFNESLCFVLDSGGSSKKDKKNNTNLKERSSIFHLTQNSSQLLQSDNLTIDNMCSFKPKSIGVSLCEFYSEVTNRLGFGNIGGEGKTMGLSSYGKFNSKIPSLLKNLSTDPNLAWFELGFADKIYKRIDENIFPLKKFYDWKSTYSQQYNYEKDLAWRIQKDAQEVVKNYIKEYTEKTGINNVVCSGGYFLNCVSNYYLVKEFPNINFYFEPLAHDGGTAIGAAYYRWRQLNSNFKPKKQKTLYYGPKYSKEQLIEGIKKYGNI